MTAAKSKGLVWHSRHSAAKLDRLGQESLLHQLHRQPWVVYAKPPFGGPEHVLQYLARYTHRVAISNHRIQAVTDSHVTFRRKDYAHPSRQRTMTLTGEEFLRRLVQLTLAVASWIAACWHRERLAGRSREAAKEPE